MLDSFSKIQNIWESSVNKNQQNGKKTEQFIYTNYVENCDYVALEAEMLRDWLIVVIKNSSLSEKLQLDHPELTLENEEKIPPKGGSLEATRDAKD